MNLLARLRDWLRRGRRNLLACWFVLRDARTPGRVRLLIAAAIAYAISPLDAIPDVLPLAGYLDDAVLVPLTLALSLRLTPADIAEQARAHADTLRSRSVLAAAALLLLLWIAAIAAFAWWLAGRLSG